VSCGGLNVENKMAASKNKSLPCLRDQSAKDLFQPWPTWAIRAAARWMQMLLPTTTTKEWEKAFAERGFEGLDLMFQDGRGLGHQFALVREVKKMHEETPSPNSQILIEGLEKQKWLTITKTKGGIEIERKQGFQNQLFHQIQQLTDEAPNSSEVFADLARAKKAKVLPRAQDYRAQKVYFFVMLYWPTIEKFRGRTMREFYEWFRPLLGPPFDEEDPNVDDAKEQHFKWFEKLFQRNLGLHLKPKGRRAKRLKKKPTTA
jgi:hypothetical protein